ncbi:hypothetical protein MTO96_031982 [Rhipicephalus appendiculatus]
MDASLDFCPGNQSTLAVTFNASRAAHEARLKEDAVSTVFKEAIQQPGARGKAIKRKAQQDAYEALALPEAGHAVSNDQHDGSCEGDITTQCSDAYEALALPEAGHAESNDQHDGSCEGDITTQCSDAYEALALPEAGHAESHDQHDGSCEGDITTQCSDAYEALALPEAGHAESNDQHDGSCEGDITTQCSDAQGVQPQTRDVYVQTTAHAQSAKAVQTYIRKQSTGVQTSPLPSSDSCDQTDDMLLCNDEVLPEVRPSCSTPNPDANAPVLNLSGMDYFSDDICSSEDLESDPQ